MVSSSVVVRRSTSTKDRSTTSPPPRTNSTSGIGRSYRSPNACARTNGLAAARVDGPAERLERLRLRAVVDVGALAGALDESGLAQLLEVMADRRRGQADGRREIAGADAGVGLGEQHAHQLHADR